MKSKIVIILLLMQALLLFCPFNALAAGEGYANVNFGNTSQRSSNSTTIQSPDYNKINFGAGSNTTPGVAGTNTTGTNLTQSQADDNPGIFSKLLGDLISALPNAIIDVTGLVDLPNLVFNDGGSLGIPGTGQQIWGIFSREEYDKVIKPYHTAFTRLAWIIVVGLIYVAGIQLARAGASSTKRVRLYSIIENWFVGAVLLGGNVLIMDTVFKISQGAIKFFEPSNMFKFIDFMQFNFGHPINALGKLLVSPLIMIAILGVTFALNFIYAQRYFVMIVLTALAPLFCVTWFSDKTRHIFENWWKEIIALAAMPVTHAFFLDIYQRYSSVHTVDPVLQLFFLILMIPMSDMVRGMIGAAGSGKGLNNNLLLGIGLGASLGLAKSMMSLGEAAVGSGAIQAGAGMLRGAAQAIPGGGGINVPGASDGQPSLSQIMGNNEMLQGFQQRVVAGRNIGSKVGRVFGGLGGAVFGAATGNNMAAAMGSMMGTQVGDSLGAGFGGGLSVAGTQLTERFSPKAAEQIFEGLGQGNIMQARTGADGESLWERDEGGQFKLDGNGHRIPIMEPIVNSALAKEFGRASFAGVKAQAYSGVPLVGNRLAQSATKVSTQATAAAQTMLPNPLDTSYRPGDMIQRVTTDSGSHYYKLGQEGVKEYLYSTAEISPMASAQNPLITESRFIESKEGDLQEKVLRQGFKGNFATARGTHPALILNTPWEDSGV